MSAGASRVSERVVRSFVHELLTWDLATVSVTRIALGDRSGLMPVLAAIELGVLGNGCEGTKGVGHAPVIDRQARRADPLASGRYHTLCDQDQRTADAVIADGQGDQIVAVHFGSRVIECTLAQRVGFRLVDTAKHDRWVAKVLAKDGRCALEGSETLGAERLEAAARAWFQVGG